MNLYEQYKNLSLFELMLLFHLHTKEAKLLSHPSAENIQKLANSYLELIDIRIQREKEDWTQFGQPEEIVKQTLEAFIKTRENIITNGKVDSGREIKEQ